MSLVSAKTQKLFLKEPAQDGFRDYALTEPSQVSGGGESIRPFQGPAEKSEKVQSFGLPEVFWNWVKDDPEVNAQLETLIEARVSERLGVKEAAALAEAREKGHQEGLNLGREEARQELQEKSEQLSRACDAVLKEKVSILKDHEESWGQALAHLLKRFLVPNRDLALTDIDTWIREGLTNFERTGKIRLHLCEEDHRKLESILHQMPKANWELVKDLDLKPGEVRCDSSAGGILFSSKEEMERVFGIIERYTLKGTGS